MAELIVQGKRSEDRWRRRLPPGRILVLGRQAGEWSIPWEPYLSQQHLELVWRPQVLEVRRLPQAQNPVYVKGREAQQFELRPGEHFVVGQTQFALVVDDEATLRSQDRSPVAVHTFSAQELEQVRYRSADQRLSVLSRLPDVIKGAATETELLVSLGHLLLAGIPRATLIALVAVEPGMDPAAPVRVLHWERRRGAVDEGVFQPSARLVLEALRRRQQSVLHVWGPAGAGQSTFTLADNADWAFCTPVRGDSGKGWGIYVTGRLASGLGGAATPAENLDLKDDLKFTELVASILGSLRQLERLQRNQASLSRFFSPAVLGMLAHEDLDVVLKPQEAEVSVLFCDMRGFSRHSEKHAHELLPLLERVSKALGVMTRNILDQGGVVGDFHGDAAMGFWGWPLPQADAARRACLAALGVRREFEEHSRRADDPLSGFQVGIGIASGRAVAGKIGTTDQVKVTVFGPAANLASRLEGLTKTLRASILLDEATAAAARRDLSPDQGRLRCVARVRPFGLETPLLVTELLPPEAEFPTLSATHISDYEAAVEAVTAGDWDRALELLYRVPPSDRVKDFLTVYIAEHHRMPPPDWDGVIAMTQKG